MTGIMELLEQDGIQLKKVSKREYHSPCPVCGGKDRFVIWPEEKETGRAWCRQCRMNVDSIGYLMTVHSMTFPQAAARVGKRLPIPPRIEKWMRKTVQETTAIKPAQIMAPEEETGEPSPLWSDTAARFVEWAAENLRRNTKKLERVHQERGISPATAEAWRLGWNPEPLKRSGKPWGTDGELFFPEGLVIPNIRNGKPVSVKIRKQRGEPKYHLVRGSKVFPFHLPGEVRGTIAIVEGEFDALLLWETAHDILTPIAFGGCSNHPDLETLDLIAKAGIILNCMDRDEPGEQAGTWWKEWFPQCFRWKPTRKDPGEMHAAGENVRHWIFDGIRAALHKHGLWPGKLDFYEAVDNLSDSFPLEVLRTYADEEIERLAIMVESGIPLKAAEKYLKIGKEKRV